MEAFTRPKAAEAAVTVEQVLPQNRLQRTAVEAAQKLLRNRLPQAAEPVQKRSRISYLHPEAQVAANSAVCAIKEPSKYREGTSLSRCQTYKQFLSRDPGSVWYGQ